MIARLAVLACAVLCGSAAIAATQYGVEELSVGAQLKFDSASYREFRCNPSEQFEGLTWYQKTGHESVLPNQQPRAIQLAGDAATSPEAQEGAGEQTPQTIQSESASGATHIVRLEKPQPAAVATRIEATPATGAEFGNHDTEDDRVGEPTDAHAVIPPSDAEPAAADAKSSRWEKKQLVGKLRLWRNCRLAAPVGSPSNCDATELDAGNGAQTPACGRLVEADRSLAGTSGGRWRDRTTSVVTPGSPR
jgi:hypothetical protein